MAYQRTSYNVIPRSVLTLELSAFIDEFDLVITSPDTAFEGASCPLPPFKGKVAPCSSRSSPDMLYRKNSGLFVMPKYVYLDGQLCLFEDELP